MGHDFEENVASNISQIKCQMVSTFCVVVIKSNESGNETRFRIEGEVVLDMLC